MKVFINSDNRNTDSVKTEEKLIEFSSKLNIEIVEEIAKADIIISIGGDGTFLKSSKLGEKPIIGINTGTLGYLTEINPDNIEKSLKEILNGNFHIENRMMLEGKIIKANGEIIKIPESLNEIAISKTHSAL